MNWFVRCVYNVQHNCYCIAGRYGLKDWKREGMAKPGRWMRMDMIQTDGECERMQRERERERGGERRGEERRGKARGRAARWEA
jgi:hypothetical protein